MKRKPVFLRTRADRRKEFEFILRQALADVPLILALQVPGEPDQVIEVILRRRPAGVVSVDDLLQTLGKVGARDVLLQHLGKSGHSGFLLEADLWRSADTLRANSDLKASEYSTPVLGLIACCSGRNATTCSR